MYNILVNNLSIMNFNVKVNTYSFQTLESKQQEKNPRTIKGIYTNEPVTHIIIQELKEKQEKLDKIICLATETVRKKNVKTNAEHNGILEEYLGFPIEEIHKQTHYQLYDKYVEKMVSEEYRGEEEAVVQEKIPNIEAIEVNDNAEAGDIYKAVTEAAKKIIEIYREHNGECRLYLDYTGGDRAASTLVIALTKMLEERRILVDHIYAVTNFDSSKKIQTIQEKIEVNYIFDFISGLNEFTSYGRAEKLNEFIEKSRNIGAIRISEQADKVLLKINKVADHIQLCRSSTIAMAIGELVNAIKDYDNKDMVHEPVFDYLIEDIKNNYKDIYEKKDRTIPNIIKWCLDKNLIQQAATFYAELLPKYLVDEKILYFTKTEWEKGEICGKNTVYKNDVRNYLYNGTTDRERIRKGDRPDTKYRHYSDEYGFINYYICYGLFQIKQIRSDSEQKKYRTLVKQITEEHSPYAIIGPGIKAEKLADLLANYFQFKSLVRNPLNHASKEALDMRKIKTKMIWKNEEAVFMKNGKSAADVTVEVLTKMIRDLLEQIKTIK